MRQRATTNRWWCAGASTRAIALAGALGGALVAATLSPARGDDGASSATSGALPSAVERERRMPLGQAPTGRAGDAVSPGASGRGSAGNARATTGDSTREAGGAAGGGVGASANAPAGGGGGVTALLEMALPLGVVLGVIVLSAWGLRKAARRGSTLASSLGPGGQAPSGVVEVLGRYPVARGQMLVLMRLDRRVLLLGHSSPTGRLGAGGAGGGFSTLCELSDPEDVASILMKVEEGSGRSFGEKLTRVLRQSSGAGDDVHDVRAIDAAAGRRARRSEDGDEVQLWDERRASAVLGGAEAAPGPRAMASQLASQAPDPEGSLRERLMRLRTIGRVGAGMGAGTGATGAAGTAAGVGAGGSL
jgi:hypothetical protein